MDFTSTIANATKRSILQIAIDRREETIWSDSWHMGVDPADLPADYAAPAVDPTPAETDLEAHLGVLGTLKAALAAVPA